MCFPKNIAEAVVSLTFYLQPYVQVSMLTRLCVQYSLFQGTVFTVDALSGHVDLASLAEQLGVEGFIRVGIPS